MAVAKVSVVFIGSSFPDTLLLPVSWVLNVVFGKNLNANAHPKIYPILHTSSQDALAHELPFDLDRAYRSVPARCDLERHAPLFAPIPLLAASDAPLAFVLGLEATYTRRATGTRNSYFSLSGFQKRRKRKDGGLDLLGW